LDPRELEDAIRFPLRAKVENHENLLVAVLPVVHAVDVEGNTRGEGGFTPDKDDWILALAVGDRNSIVTIIDGDPSVLDRLRRGVEEKPDRIVEGSRAVRFEIVDEEGVDAIDKGIWDAEKAVLESRSGNVQRQIHKLTGQAVKPLAAALEHLNENGAPVAHRHLCRTRHHVLRVMERLDGSRDLLSSLLYLNLTMVGQKISAWGAILIVPTLIAGVFGMNFTEEWWTRAEHGFEVMIAVMVLVSGFLYLWFRRSGWL
jgi:magnesium transporter